MSDNQHSSSATPNLPSPLTPVVEAQMAAFVGPRWEKTYRRKLLPFFSEPSFLPTWNWAAALAAPFWFLYRKMYLWFAFFFFVPGAALQWLVPSASTLTPDTVFLPENEQALLMSAAVQISARIAAGGIGNWLLFRRAQTALRVIGAQQIGEEDSLQLLRRVGGTNAVLTWAMAAFAVMLAVASAAGTLAP